MRRSNKKTADQARVGDDDTPKSENDQENKDYIFVKVGFKKENFEKIQAYTTYANVEAKMDKIDVEYTAEDFIKGATMYFIDSMLDNIDAHKPKEITRKLYESLPEFLPILNESAKRLGNTSKENVEPLIHSHEGAIKNNLKKILKEQKMTQKELSEITGIDKSNLSIYMNNKSQPSIEFFLRIWHALDYPPLNEMLYREKSSDA
ncbi:helix-turn-helix domain-containing protein [Metabacillus sediminilitoris]|uniref:Helix-turn-helix transcriptional regulator n=1 Tax=Metabacillus sediminilitoris TaxID=2567941 RepID=A0A4S4C181_9BACI|nr:helix-turn-helix transcriptional regulator [Metabacillus sediminilitoris]QGQ48240.1 helix-turn-helix domain-containing protein [Metabacillus sediminilitoris]THF81401.1 helix-turn-helix transcriptional regulator [Metabacillus sediminilitoris]